MISGIRGFGPQPIFLNNNYLDLERRTGPDLDPAFELDN